MIARFSNGLTDEYKGRRPVRAAWLVIHPNGEKASGHSLTRKAAESTARNHITSSFKGGPFVAGLRTRATANYLAWALKVSKERGFDSIAAHDADVLRRRSEYVAQCKIEIVDLQPEA